MAVIKSAQSSRLLKEAVVLDMGDLGRQAQRILNEARREAEEIIQDAKAQADRLVAGADARGYAEGVARGHGEGLEAGRKEGRELALAEWREQFEDLSKAWTEALASWELQRDDMLHDAREGVIRFALALAGKVVRRMVQTDPAIVRDQLSEALALVARPTSLEITLHPDDRAAAENELPQLAAKIASCRHTSIREDPSMSRGGCIISTAGGRVDASIETQLDRIAEALFPGEKQ